MLITSHQGFNTATSSFSHVLSNFSESQKLVRKLQETLSESKRLLQSRNQNLAEYYFQNRKAAKLKEILEKIQYVLETPAWVQAYVERKQHVHAVVLLQHTLGLLGSEDLVGVDGLMELREEILVRKHFMQQFLVEEVHRIVYAKEKDANVHIQFVSPHASSSAQRAQFAPQENVLTFNADGTRVKTSLVVDPALAATNRSPTMQGAAAGGVGGGGGSGSGGGSGESSRPTPNDSKYSPFYQGSASFDDGFELASSAAAGTAAGGVQDARARALSSQQALSSTLQSLLNDEAQESYVKNPESSPHKFLAHLVEALDHMNHLPSVKTQINKRVRAELLAIVARETNLARERAKFSLPRRVQARATESGYLTQGSDLLVDLIERVFHVLANVLRNHLDVLQMIHARLRAKGMMAAEGAGGGGGAGARAGGENAQAAKFSIEGVWQVMQIVLQATLSEYLHASDDRSSRTGAADANARSSAAAAAAANKRKTNAKSQAADLLSELSFSFEDSSAPSVAKMSRGEKQQPRDYVSTQTTSQRLSDGVRDRLIFDYVIVC